jgi:parvulin-like peptidyl-prolyl isomerase
MIKPRFVPCLLAFLLAVPAAAPLRAEVLNRIVLRVNDQIATLYEYQNRRAELSRDILRRDEAAEQRTKDLAQAGEITFKDLYEELLLESRAEQLNVEVTNEQIDAAEAQMKQNFGIKSDEDFAQALAQSGLSEPQLRTQIRRNLRMREVMGREVQSRIKVDEDDVRRAYQKNQEKFRQPQQLQLREVVVLDEGGAPAEQRASIAREIRQAVAGGKTLDAAVADEAAKGTASNVIDLGWVSPGDLDPNLESAVWKLPKGSVSDPVPARGGLHLVQVVDRRESRIPPFSEVQASVQAEEQDRVYRQELAKYMAELEKKSLIVADPPPEAANFRKLLGTQVQGQDELGLGAVTPDPGEAAAAEAAGATAPKTPAVTPPAQAGEPGALPEPKPVTNTLPPVIQEPGPQSTEAPPPPSTPPPS